MRYYSPEEWTIEKLRESSAGLVRASVIGREQPEGTALRGFDMELYFSKLAASEDAIHLSSGDNEFTIEKPVSIVATDISRHIHIAVTNEAGERFTILIEPNRGAAPTREKDIDSQRFTGIASNIKTVKIKHSENNVYSLSKEFTHFLITDNDILLHDTRPLYNNYMHFADVKDVQLNNNAFSFINGSGTAFTLDIEADTPLTLEALTAPLESDTGTAIISETDARKDRYSALEALREWYIDGKAHPSYLSSEQQPDTSPFKLHNWLLRFSRLNIQPQIGEMSFYGATLRGENRLSIKSAVFSLIKHNDCAVLDITDTDGRRYIIDLY